MGIERARVVEVHSATSATGRVGAGYLVGDRLVLTASDVAGRKESTDVRPGGTVTWYPAATVWTALSGDVAVVEVDEPLAMPAGMRWGDVCGPRPVPVTAMGFPPQRGRPDRFRDAEQFFGHLHAGEVEAAPASRLSGAGLHGAALFAGAELVGVVTAAGDHLRAVPVSALTTDRSFVDLVGPVELVPVRGSMGGLSIL